MPRTLLLVGTRKGCFLLESDDERRDWSVRGPLCESWPVYHAVHDPASGAIYAAAASEWHGSAVWRSDDLGETWALSSDGLGYDEDGARQGLEGLLPRRADGRVLVGVEAPGIFESRDGGETWSLLTTLAGQPGSEVWDDPANQPPGHLGISAIMPDGDDPSHFWTIVQGVGLFETGDGGTTWTPRNRGLRADWPRQHEEVGFCVHRLVRSPADRQRMYQQNHVGMHRSDDGGHSWIEITDGLPSEFGFAAAAHPHDRDTFYVIPLDPGHARCMPDGQRRGLAHARRRRELAAARPRPPAARRAPRRAARRDDDRRATTFRASTSARAPASSSRAPTRARAGARSRATCRRSGRSSRDGASNRWPNVRLPTDADAALRRPAAPRRDRRGDRRRGDRRARRALARPPRPALRAGPRSARTSTSTSTGSAPRSTRRSSRARGSTT